MSKKKQVLDILVEKYFINEKKEFSTEDIKQVCQPIGFKNHFDVAKIDKIKDISKKMKENGLSIEKSSKGNYYFKKGGLSLIYHELETIDENEVIEIDFKPSIIYCNVTSEDDVLNCIDEHGIANDFCQSISMKVKSTGRRQFEGRQIETDGIMISTADRLIRTSELKNEHGESFNMNQLFYSYRYYKLNEQHGAYDVKALFIQNKKFKSHFSIQVFEYIFTDLNDITSIKLTKKGEYRLKF